MSRIWASRFVVPRHGPARPSITKVIRPRPLSAVVGVWVAASASLLTLESTLSGPGLCSPADTLAAVSDNEAIVKQVPALGRRA